VIAVNHLSRTPFPAEKGDQIRSLLKKDGIRAVALPNAEGGAAQRGNPAGRQILRWTFIGPLVGVIAVSPITFMGSGLFGKPLLPKFAAYSAILYLLGIPAALATGFACRWLTKKMRRVVQRNVVIALAGAVSSTYLVWILVLIDVFGGKLDLDGISVAFFPMAIGLISTLGMLALESWRSHRVQRRAEMVRHS
jgi:hypothetical protein